MTHAIAPATAAPDLEAVRGLFREYAASLDVDLGLQGFAAELAGLPGAYAAPGGALLLARSIPGGCALGCIGVRPLPGCVGGCEVKRLYAVPTARGTGLGRGLVQGALHFAERAGYGTVRLDTLPSMAAATALYRSLGFTAVPPYGDARLPGMLYFGLVLGGVTLPAPS